MSKPLDHIKQSFLLPSLFVVFIAVIHLYEVVFEFSLTGYGLYPRSLKGVLGWVTMPLIHGDWKHLFNNSTGLLFLLAGLRYFYKNQYARVFWLTYLIPNVLTWFFARPAFHIGASAMIYALAAFLFFSGILKMNRYLLAFTLIIAFWYGSLVWGVFPIEPQISWEGHLSGAVTGFWLAILFRKKPIDDHLIEPDPFVYETDEEDPIIGDQWKEIEAQIVEKEND